MISMENSDFDTKQWIFGEIQDKILILVTKISIDQAFWAIVH